MTRRTFRAFAAPTLFLFVAAAPALHAAAADTPAATRPASRPADGPPENAPGTNAALRYWIALSQLPTLDPAQQKVVDDWQTTPLNADAHKVIESADAALRYLRRGAAAPACDWGLPLDEGFSLLLPHLGKGRQLARIALLRARDRFARGDAAGAADDVADALTLGRHLGFGEGIVIANLVRYNVEQAAVDVAAPHLAGLPPDVLDRLAGRLDRLPAGPTARDSVRIERDFGQRYLIAQVRAKAASGDWQAFLAAVLDGPAEGGVPPAEDARSIVKASGGTAEGVVAQLEKLDSFYEAVGPLLELPPDQFRARYADLTAAVKDNPFANKLLPNFARVYDTTARYRARLAMFRAAVAVARGGPDKARDVPDPFAAAGEPFAYRAVPGGFELTSKLVLRPNPDRDAEALTLTVGGGR